MLGDFPLDLHVCIGVRSPAAAAGVRAFVLEAGLSVVTRLEEADILLVDDSFLQELGVLSGFSGGVVALGSLVWAAALAELGLPGWAALPPDAGPLEVVAGVLAAAAGLAAVSAEQAGVLGEGVLGEGLLTNGVLAAGRLSELGGEAEDLSLDPLSAVSLTPREREVLELLAAGLSNKRAAKQLGLSEHTVKFHAQAIYSKLGVQNRAAAVTRGVQLGLLSV